MLKERAEELRKGKVSGFLNTSTRCGIEVGEEMTPVFIVKTEKKEGKAKKGGEESQRPKGQGQPLPL